MPLKKALKIALAFDHNNNRHLILKVKISRGKELRLRHFQTGLEPIYKE
ncbi:MAG: hypothetical protein ACTSWY_15610 [Promethearchaeota archaeon]